MQKFPATQEPVSNTPAEHTHNWVAVTETVTITDSEATTKTETVSKAWDETVVDKKEEYTWVAEFNYDVYIPTSEEDFATHQIELADAYVDASYHSKDIVIPAVTHVVHHDAVTKTVNVPAVTHTEERVIGYKCSCGATK